MDNILKFSNHCCGCGECYNVCPQNAITMQENEKGFFVPIVNESLCNNCGKCIKRCSFNLKREESKNLPDAYVVKHKLQEVIDNSRSGGIFTALSDIVLNKGGVVYGCKLFNNVEAKHVRVTTKEGRDDFRGSKYIQSTIYDTFSQVEKDLKNGFLVLYSGTACQISAIKDYISLDLQDNLYTIDIVCHGVPSPKVWRDYLCWVEKKQGKKAVKVDFRDKLHFGWRDHQETIYFENGRYSDDKFKRMFYDHYIIRESCFDCPYKNVNRVGDVSIADCWGVENNNKEYDDDKGVSLVLCSSSKGKTLFSQATADIVYTKVNVLDYLQDPLKQNWPIPEKYNEFWKDYNEKEFSKIIKKYVPKQKKTKTTFFKKVIIKCKLIAKRILKK